MSQLDRVVFLVGAPRSGTTWLQSLLGSHPDVVTPQETDLFSGYVAPLEEAWEWQMRGDPEAWARRRYKGVPAVVTRERFDGLVRGFVAPILEAAADLKPTARVLVEKSPSHSLHTGLVRRVLPEARFLHIIRDGRDVAASLLAAGHGWGASWAPRSVRGAAEMWVSHVLGARQAASMGPLYREVRYEELRSDGGSLLAEAFQLCDVAVTAEGCRELIGRMSLERMSAAEETSSVLVGGELARLAESRSEPAGFYGQGRTGGWRATWSPRETRIFDAVAGDLLVELGYEADRTWIDQGGLAAGATTVVAGGARAASALLRRASRQADRLAERLP
jgi:hypothetical protein